MKKIVLKRPVSPEQSALVADYLNRGAIIAYPTDTVYGLGCRADNGNAVGKIKKMKGSRDDKPLLVLMRDLKQVKQYCFLSDKEEALLKKLQAEKRPTTFILRHKGLLPRIINPNSDGLGFRLPKSLFLRKILKAVDYPIVSTSLNISGGEQCSSLRGLPASLKPDLAIDDGPLIGSPSRLIDIRRGKIKVIRS